MDQNFCDRIATICLDFFANLPKSGKPTEQEWTVLSCVIKQNVKADGSFQIVALGTGSKCIGKSMMSKTGDVLNDSHAEVFCRRGFLRYLYEEIKSSYSGNSEIFENASNGKAALKKEFRFHFFSTHVPCGDAAIFPKQDEGDFGDCVETSKRKLEAEITGSKRVKIDIFRTGAKCLPEETEPDTNLPGVGYHTVGVVRTKPGRGDPTLSVSCSDKIAKWCFLGIQGSLIMSLIEEPIHLDSFVICGGTPFGQQALLRAFRDRFGPTKLEPPFKYHLLKIGQATINFHFGKSDKKQPCPSSISWSKVNFKPLEVAVNGRKQGVTKSKLNSEVSRLQICKIELFKNFLKTAEGGGVNLFGDKSQIVTYREAKHRAENYQIAWRTVKKNCFKVWTIKDESLLNFLCTD